MNAMKWMIVIALWSFTLTIVFVLEDLNMYYLNDNDHHLHPWMIKSFHHTVELLYGSAAFWYFHDHLSMYIVCIEISSHEKV